MGSVAALPHKMTFSDLQRLPEDGPRIELYDGEVCVVTSPMPRHQAAVFNTAMVLEEHAGRTGGRVLLAPLDIVFSELDVVQPDVVYFLPERAHVIRPTGVTRDRPDLTVEVLSPGTASNDRGRKLRMFAKYGVPEYWIVDADARALEILSLRGNFFVSAVEALGDATIASPLLPALTFQLSRLFKNC